MLPALLVFSVGVFLVVGPTPGVLQGMVEGVRPHPEAERAAARLFSPHCPGVTLAHCPAEGSVALRDTLHTLASQGVGAEELERKVLDSHGAHLATVPPFHGSGLLLWAGPPAILFFGVAGFALFHRRIAPVPSDPVEVS